MLMAVCRRKSLVLLHRIHATVGQIHCPAMVGGSDMRSSARFFATPSKILVPDNEGGSALHEYARRPPQNYIESLDPGKFASVGQQPVNLSPKRDCLFAPSFRPRVLFYYPAGAESAEFPPETRGYLYYKNPADGQPDISGSLRFRVLPAGGSSFEQGSDLQTPVGTPWRIFLYTIAKFINYRSVATMLRREGFVTQGTLDQLQNLPAIRFRNRSAVLHGLSEPFLTDLSFKPTSVFFITPHTIVAWKDFYQSAFSVNLDSGRGFPFKGLVRVRLEKSPLPKHENTYTVVLRVLEIVQPVECVVPQYKYQLATPVAGELLMRKRLGSTEYTPWSFDLGKWGQNLDSLFVRA